MIKDLFIDVKISGPTFNYYKNLGYDVIVGSIISVKLEHIPKSSNLKVNVCCDICSSDKIVIYNAYNKYLDRSPDNKYRCNKCNSELRKRTCIDKYGTTHFSKTDTFSEKRKSTIIKRYGVEHYNKLDIFKDKIKNTNIDKYGVEYPMMNTEVVDKFKNTNIDKYGESSPLHNKSIKEKSLKTMISKYGAEYSMQINSIANKIVYKSNETKIKNILNDNKDILEINYEDNYYLIKCNSCNSNFTITPHMFTMRTKSNTTICTKCNSIDSKTSGCENMLLEYIKTIYDGDIISNSKKVIYPYELDIFLPDLKIAFEFNGLYWHSNVFKEKNYHKVKSDLCEKNGIQLVHIWEDDWSNKNDIVKSIINNKLQKINNKIFARNCEIKIVNDNSIIRKFLNENHLQGFVASSIKIGLFYNDELVSLMTFGGCRKIMNSKNIDNEYELIRFCNKLNTVVVGGASKIFKFFISEFRPNSIVSYADRSYSNGNLYESLGFDFLNKTEPNYYYIVNGIRVYRFKFRKDVLVKQGYDKNKSESEIMLERGINKIYNAGNLKYFINFTKN